MMGGMLPDDMTQEEYQRLMGGRRGGSSSTKPQNAIEEVSDEEDEEKFEATHECQVCGEEDELDDYQKHTPSWCKECGKVQTHKRIE